MGQNTQPTDAEKEAEKKAVLKRFELGKKPKVSISSTARDQSIFIRIVENKESTPAFTV